MSLGNSAITEYALTESPEAGIVAGSAIDTITSPVVDNQQGAAFTVSGFGSPITSFTIKDVEADGLNVVDLSASLTGTYLYNMPDITGFTVATLGTMFDSAYWSHIGTANDGTDSGTIPVVVNPQIGWARVDVSETPSTAAGSVFETAVGFFDDVTAVSVANPSQLTIVATAGWTDGQEVTLAGFTTTPDINGTQVITIVDSTHVSIPVNVTVVTDGVGTMLTGAASEHGQIYHPTTDATTADSAGLINTSKTADFTAFYFNLITHKQEPFTVFITPSATQNSKVIGFMASFGRLGS